MERGIYSVFIAADISKNIDIGLAALYADGAFGAIPEFYVRPEFRSKGIGRMLLESARKYGISKG